MRYELIPATDIRLNGISMPVAEADITSRRVQDVVEAMLSIAIGERDADKPAKPTMVGLAAPQIGIFERIIVLDTAATANVPNYDPDLQVIINPEITYASSEEELGREGCYSVTGCAAAVYRASTVCLRGLDRYARRLTFTLDGFQARITQHEVDHLNGIRCPDRIRDPAHLHGFTNKEKQFQAYRENWRNWPLRYPISSWYETKRGVEPSVPAYDKAALEKIDILSERQV